MKPIDRFGLDLKRIRFLPPDRANDELFFLEEEPGVGKTNLEHAIGRQSVHDSQLFRELWPHLQAGDIVLADRAFCSYAALGALAARY